MDETDRLDWLESTVLSHQFLHFSFLCSLTLGLLLGLLSLHFGCTRLWIMHTLPLSLCLAVVETSPELG